MFSRIRKDNLRPALVAALIVVFSAAGSQSQSTSLVSINYPGNGSANDNSVLQGLLGPDLRGDATSTTVSADGRYIVFYSAASDLLPNNTTKGHCYVRDLRDKKTMLIDVNRLGTGAGNAFSVNPMISSNGRFVLFTSYASDLVVNDTNGRSDVFVRDLYTQTTKLVSVNRDGTDSGKTPSSFFIPDPFTDLSYGDGLSADGRFALFRSYATNLVANDTNGALNLFVRDMVVGTTVCVNVNLAGKPSGNLTSLTSSGVFQFTAVMSPDGRYVAFESHVNDLVDNDNLCAFACDGKNGLDDVFVRDLMNNKTTLVSVNRAGTNGGNSYSSEPSISADGRMIAFRSFATDLVSNDSTPQSDIYVRDLAKGVTTLVSVNRDGTGAGTNGGGIGTNSYYPHISANARFVAFTSSDVDLVPNKTNVLASDVFVRDLLTNKTILVSVNRTGNDGGRGQNTNSVPRVFSGDGRFLVFSSNAADLVPNDTDSNFNIFIRDLFMGSTSLVDVNLAGVSSGDGSSHAAHITPDGRFVAFQSQAPDLVGIDGKDNIDVFARGVFKDYALDDTYFFVRQHYVDFLGREPDGSGEDFWSNQITQCGSDQQCVEVKRINVSAAFFLSIEFQQTGYLVERIYKAAYGDRKGTSTFNGSHQLDVPIVRFDEFLPDTQMVGNGVVVLQPGWEQQLESNKQAFVMDFVQRSRFRTAFPDSITPEQFVDRLNQNAGNVLSPSEKTEAISLFGGAQYANNRAACAQVLRQVAENQSLYNAEFNRAFVLMQYFGYLRRNPNDPQDSDYTGYDFWLTKLNQFNGNFVNADMVKAFIVSGEYRSRFGP